jgi:methionine--tRNA ligase beta chain
LADSSKVSFEEFLRLDLRVGKIVEANPVLKSRSLLRLGIDVGGGVVRQAVAGVGGHYSCEELVGLRVAILANLEPKRIFGLESEVMILAAEDGSQISILMPDKPVRSGSRVK